MSLPQGRSDIEFRRYVVLVWIAMWLYALVIALTGCAPIETRPPEVRTITTTVLVSTPVPCFKEGDRPVLKPPTPVDIDNATVDQLVAAIAADLENELLYTKDVDALFLACSLKGVKP